MASNFLKVRDLDRNMPILEINYLTKEHYILRLKADSCIDLKNGVFGMDWFSVVEAGICGGIGGLVGALAARRISNKNIKSAVFVAPLILSIQLGPLLIAKSGIRDMISPRTKVENAMSDPKIKSQSSILSKAVENMSKEQARQFTEQKSRLGLKRLDLADLIKWNVIRMKLADVNPALCAGFWTGQGVTGEILVGALNTLPDENVIEWLHLGQRAAILELEQRSYAAPPEGIFVNELMKIKSSMNFEDGLRFNQTLQLGANAKSEDACWALKRILNSVDSMNPQVQEDFLRAIAAL